MMYRTTQLRMECRRAYGLDPQAIQPQWEKFVESDVISWIVLAAALLLIGLAAAAEIALSAVNRSEVRRRSEEGDRRAALLNEQLSDPVQFWLTVMLIKTLGVVAAGVAAGFMLLTHSGAFGMVGGILATWLILAAVQIAVRSLVLRAPKAIAFALAPFLRAITMIFSPVTFFLYRAGLRLSGEDQAESDESIFMSEDGLRFLMQVNDEESEIQESEKQMIASILEMDETVLSEQVRSFLSRSSAAKSTLKVSSQLEGRVVTCDSRRVIRILANFVENADKYAGGVVAVTIEKEGEHVLIGVEDAGPGVPIDEQQRIFSRFSRGVHGGARGSDTGSGLGLALAQEHARLHGGSVWVEARENGENGSRFVVSLPLLEGDGDGEFVDQQDLPSLANAEHSPPDIDAHDGEWDTDERSEDRPNDPDGDDGTSSEPTSPITAATDSDPNVSSHSSSLNGAPESVQTPPAPLDADPTGTIEHAQ